jgi:hypothetical protein
MRPVDSGVAGLMGVVIAFGLAGPAGAAKNSRTRSFSETSVGAPITSDGSESVFKVTDSVDGQGAGVQTTTANGNTYPILGADKNTTYFTDGVSRSTDTWTLAKPGANGISTITGKGECTGGTGVYKTKKCTFMFVGTVNTKTGIFSSKVTGTFTS